MNPISTASNQEDPEHFELIVDSLRRTLERPGHPAIDAAGCEIPLRLLEKLLEAGGDWVGRPVLFEAAWQMRYRGKADDARLAYNLARLRRLLGQPPRTPGFLRRARQGYALDSSARILWLGRQAALERMGRSSSDEAAQTSIARAALSFRQIAEWIAARTRVANRDLRRCFGLTRSGAQRLLERLTAAGLVVPRGRGRGTVHTISPCILDVLSLP